MPTIAVEPNLYERIQRVASAHQENVDELLDQALRHYLWELDRRKISNESKIYKKQHSQLIGKYLGQYIAMHDGQVVDSDADFAVLRQRIQETFGDTAVMITLVENVADPMLVRHGIRMERT